MRQYNSTPKEDLLSSDSHYQVICTPESPSTGLCFTAYSANPVSQSGVFLIKIGNGTSYRRFTNARANTKSPKNSPLEFCVDTGSSLSLMDRDALRKHFPDVPLHTMENSQSVHIAGIGEGPSTSTYVNLPLVLTTDTGKEIQIQEEVHVVPKLSCQLLLGINILRPNEIGVSWSTSQDKKKDALLIRGERIPLNAVYEAPSQAPRRTVIRTITTTRIPSGHGKNIPIRAAPRPELADGYLLNPTPQVDLALSKYGSAARGIFEAHCNCIPYCNLGDTEVLLPAGTVIGHFEPMPSCQRQREVDNAVTYLSLAELFEGMPPAEPDHELDIRDLPYLGHYPIEGPDSSIDEADISPHWGKSYQQQVHNLLGQHPKLFRKELGMFNDGINMPIPFIDEGDLKGLKQAPYNLTRKDRDAIDHILDPLVTEGRVEKVPLGKPSASSSPAFIVWKNGKPRMVVDLRKVNTRLYPDTYPLPKQDHILESLGGSVIFSSMDITKGFYQQPLKPEDRWKTTFVTPHRGQEQLTVATMGLANSPSFFQHRMERILSRYLWKFVLVYVDDIIVYSRSPEVHLQDLDSVLTLLENSGVTLSVPKCHFSYPSIDALGHHVSRLGLSTVREKTDAIREMDYPTTLNQLEIGLGFFGYYRKFVPHFAAIAQPLLDVKKTGFKNAPLKGHPRHVHGQMGISGPELPLFSPQCRTAWNELKDRLCNAPTLAYPDFDRDFILYCDGSKERGFGAALHQLDANGVERPVLFLSKSLLPHEKNYWATELEVAALVWALRKLRHYLDSGKTVVYTDHQAIQGIFRNLKDGQKSTQLNNWQLFLSQYVDRLDIRYKPGKLHQNADGLSRLQATPRAACLITEWKENLLQMDPRLQERIVRALPKDRHLGTVYKNITKRAGQDDGHGSTTLHSFRYDRDTKLLYFVEPDGRERLCLPEALHNQVLKYAHEQAGHEGIGRTYSRIRENVYLHRLRKVVEKYVHSCPICQLAKPSHHRPFGELNPIKSPEIPFATICMDFVVDLPASRQGNTVLLTITDKFTKYVRLIPGRKTDTAVQWAHRFFEQIYRHWGSPQRIISDRDSKFTSTFWQTLFKRAKVQLALSAAYHPSTDGQAERTNQTTEIALRCMLANKGSHEWESLLPDVEFTLNTAKSESTGETPFQLLYGVEARHEFTTANGTDSASDFIQNWERIRRDAADAIAMAQTRMAVYYDAKHTPMELTGHVYIKMAKGIQGGYRLPGSNSLSLVRQGPFQILQRVGKLAYELDLPPHIKIHPVISIAHLEQATPDPYNRPQPRPGPILVGHEEQYTVDRVVDHEKRSGKRFYKIHWQGYEAADDTWEPGDYIQTKVPHLVKQYKQSLLSARSIQSQTKGSQK